MTPIEMSIDILQQTNDGDDLAPTDLGLLQLATNGHLNEAGEVAFYDLHKRVEGGTYTKPFLHGIEHLTQNHEGYVLWKGQGIEHWSGDIVHSKEGRVKALELARRCQILEASGEPVNTNTVIWNWTPQ